MFCGKLVHPLKITLTATFSHLPTKFPEEPQKYIPDFICYEKIIVEIKSVSKLTDEHRAQVINYLNATGYQLGLLINFGGHPKLEWERLVHTGKKAHR